MQIITQIFSLKKTEIKLWLWACAALCLNFLPLLSGFVWGNHDWLPLMTDSSLKSGLIEGRFSQYLLPNILLSGKILPVLNTLFGFVLYTLALTLLCTRFFKFPPSSLCALFIITSALLPYIIEIIYFQFIVLSQLFWPLIIIFSLLAIQQTTNTAHPAAYTLAGTVLLFIAAGGYPASIGLFVTAVCLQMLEKAQKTTSFKSLLRAYIPYAISLACTLLLLALTYFLLRRHGLMMDMYNNHPQKIIGLIANFLPTIKISLLSLIQPQPFFSPFFKMLTTAAFILYAVNTLKQNLNIKQKISGILLLFLLLLCLKFPAWLTEDSPQNYFSRYDPIGYMVRTDFYTMPSLILFCLSSLAYSGKKILKNISVTLALLLLFTGFNANLTFSKTHLLGFKAETNLLERLNSRIKENTGYIPDNYYTLVQAGELPLRTKYYNALPFEKYGYYTLNVPYTRHWIAFEYYNFYEPKFYVREGTSVRPEQITPQMADFLTNKITVWPSPNALYVDDNYALIALTPAGKNMLSEQFNLLKRALP